MILEHATTILPDGRTLAWAECGDPDGLPTVFLHGTPGGRLGRASHHARYARQGLRVLCPDRAGYGGSDPAPGRSVCAAGADVVALLAALDVERAIVMGGSGGGPHALAAAALAPERVLAVGVLVGAAPLEPAEIAGMAELNRRVLAEVVAGRDLRPLLEPVRETLLAQGVGAVLHDAPESDRARWAAEAEAMNRTLADALAPGVQGMADDYAALWSRPWGFDPADVRAPVVWLHGRADTAVPFTAATRLARRLPHCRLIPADGGHAPDTSQFVELEAAVLAAALVSSSTPG